MRYGFRVCVVDVKFLEKGLGSSEYKLIRRLKVVGTIKEEWHYLTVAFCGMGLKQPYLATTNTFIQCYQSNSTLRITPQATLENL